MEVTITYGSVGVRLGGVESYCGGTVHPDSPSGVQILEYIYAVPGTGRQVINPIPVNDDVAITSTVPVGTWLQELDSLVVLFTWTTRPTASLSAFDEALAIVVVPYGGLSPAMEPQLIRPPAIGSPTNPSIAALRATALVFDNATIDALPSIIDVDAIELPAPQNWGSWNNARPLLSTYLDQFEGFCGELWYGWGTFYGTPALQHPGYGTVMGAYVGEALMMMLSTDDAGQRRELARRLTQWGVDLVGAFASGRVDVANGGHMQGRKALVVLSGYLLGMPWVDATGALGAVFNEDDNFFTGAPAWVWGWPYGYRGHHDTVVTIQNAIATWPTSAGSSAYYLHNYMPQVCGVQIGTALAMRLLGLTAQMGVAHDGMIAQWMEGPAPADVAAMEAHYAPLGGIPWGKSHSDVGSEHFGKAAWAAYADYMEAGAVTVYSGPGTEAYRSTKFSATVDGTPAYVYGYARTTSHKTQAWLAGASPVQSWFTFAADGTTTVAITRLAGDVTSAIVAPAGVAAQSISGGVLYLTVPANTRLRIECNGDRAEVLHLHSAPLLPAVPGGVLDWSTWGQFSVSSIDTGTGTFTLGATHSMSANTRVRVYSDNGVYPTSSSTTISESLFFYVVSPSGSTLQLSTSFGGSPIDITSTAGVGNLTIYRTTADASTDLYFPAGDWRVGRNFLMRANRTVYTHGGAHIYGTIDTRSVTPWTLQGHGTWRGTVATWEAVVSDPYNYEMVLGRDNITFRYANVVDGATFYGYPYFLCGFGVHTWRNVCLINPWTYNADGFNISKHTDGVTPGRVTDCYAFVGDDAMYLENDEHNDRVEGSFLSSTNGGVFLFGYFYAPIREEFDKVVTNCHAMTLALSDAESGISSPADSIIKCFVDAPFASSDQGFADATIDGLHVWGPLPGRFLVLINILYPFDVGRQEDAAGQITRMTFRNITCEFAPGEPSIIAGLDAANAPSDIALENIWFGATRLTAANAHDEIEIDEWARNITIDGVRVDRILTTGGASVSVGASGTSGLLLVSVGGASVSISAAGTAALQVGAVGAVTIPISASGFSTLGVVVPVTPPVPTNEPRGPGTAPSTRLRRRRWWTWLNPWS